MARAVVNKHEKIMNQHTVSAFDADLKALNDLVLDMGRAVLQQHQDASTLPASRDTDLAHRIIGGDRAVDDLQQAIEEKAIQIIARRQPMAVDLRTVIATLKKPAISSGSAISSRTTPSA